MSSGVDWDELRSLMQDAVRRAVDEVVDAFAARSNGGGVVRVQPEGDLLSSWAYTWMDGSEEHYDQARWYRVAGPSGTARVILARCVRPVRGEDLKRYIVFAQIGSEQSATFYPWTEFVETDDATYAAVVPNPARPRASLKDGEPLPTRLAGARIERTDALYSNVADGPSLRFVVDKHDAVAMIQHGYWVAEIRHRLRG